MSLIEVGIDPEAARRVAMSWSDTGARCGAVLAEASTTAATVMVDERGWFDGRVVEGLQMASALLLDRAAAMAAISWSSPFGAASGWGRWRRSPFDRDEDWIDASRQPSYLDLVSWLVTGPRGYLVQELADPTAAEWAAMVGAATIWEGARNVRYLGIEPDPGGGVIVVDFFIPELESFLLAGDDRDHVDPIFGDVHGGDSRALMVFDLESGRASIQFDETCSTIGPCNAPRPITLDGSWVAWDERDSLDIANQVHIEGGGGTLAVGYDILNGILPIGSVDGMFMLRNRGDGRYVERYRFGNEYPSVGIHQYLPDGGRHVIATHDSKGFSHLIPGWPELPDLPDWSDLPDPPDVPIAAPDWVPDVEWEGPDLPAGPDLPNLPRIVGVDLPNMPKLPDLPKLPSFDLTPDIEGRLSPDFEIDVDVTGDEDD